MQDRRAGIVLAAATVVAAAAEIVAAAVHPRAVAGSEMVVVLAVSAALLAGYLGYAVGLARRGDPRERGLGVWFGIAAAACWAAEIWVGGPARLGHSMERALGGTFSLAATVITLAAGIIAGSLAGRGVRAGSVWRTGLLAGAVSSVLVYAFAVIMTMAALTVLGGRADYQAQFPGSGLPTMDDFLVSDILGAAAAHLVINMLLGVAGAAVGRLVFALRRRPTVRAGGPAPGRRPTARTATPQES